VCLVFTHDIVAYIGSSNSAVTESVLEIVGMSRTEDLVANEQLKAKLVARRDGATRCARLSNIDPSKLEAGSWCLTQTDLISEMKGNGLNPSTIRAVELRFQEAATMWQERLVEDKSVKADAKTLANAKKGLNSFISLLVPGTYRVIKRFASLQDGSKSVEAYVKMVEREKGKDSRKIVAEINPYFVAIGIREALSFVSDLLAANIELEAIVLTATPAALKSALLLSSQGHIPPLCSAAFSQLGFSTVSTPQVLHLVFNGRISFSPHVAVVDSPRDLVEHKVYQGSPFALQAAIPPTFFIIIGILSNIFCMLDGLHQINVLTYQTCGLVPFLYDGVLFGVYVPQLNILVLHLRFTFHHNAYSVDEDLPTLQHIVRNSYRQFYLTKASQRRQDCQGQTAPIDISLTRTFYLSTHNPLHQSILRHVLTGSLEP